MAKRTLKSWSGRVQHNGHGLILSDNNGRNVAVCYDAQDTDLIAAAPDLLEALQELLATIEVEHHAVPCALAGLPQNQQVAMHQRDCEARAQARAAIAKATEQR
ncbi:MAG: hypothetical protein WC551_09415 [Patescibacteria group bacterium]